MLNQTHASILLGVKYLVGVNLEHEDPKSMSKETYRKVYAAIYLAQQSSVFLGWKKVYYNKSSRAFSSQKRREHYDDFEYGIDEDIVEICQALILKSVGS